MERPLVSVIVPTYNQEKLIANTLRSIIEQDYRPIEIIVSDDESTDGTERAVKDFGHTDIIRHLRVKHTGMPPATMNAALREAKGEIIMFLDGDDQWLPGKITKQVQYLAEHPDCAFLFTDAYYYVAEGNEFMIPDPAKHETFFQWSPPPEKVTVNGTARHTSVAILTAAMRREVFDGGILLDGSLRYTWDTEFVMRLASEGRGMHCLPEPTAVYRRHQKNLSTNYKAICLSAEEYIKIFGRYKKHFGPFEYRLMVERRKYDWIKQYVKFEEIRTLKGLFQAPYFPTSFYYRIKSLFYFLKHKLAGRPPEQDRAYSPPTNRK